MMNEKDLIKWNPGKQSLISRYVNEVLGILFIGEDGSAKTTKIFTLDIYLKIISENIDIVGIESTEIKRGLIRRAFFTRVKHYRRQDIFTFRRAVAAEARRYLARPNKDYWILLPLHVPRNQIGNARSISILETKLLLRDWDFVQRRFDFNEFMTKTRNQISDQSFSYFSRFTPVLVKTRGRDSSEAFYYAERPFDFLRWLINLMYQFGRWSQRWGGYPEPLGMILPPPTYAIFSHDGEFDQLFYTVSRYKEYRNNRLDPQILPEVRKLARKIKTPSSSKETMSILVGALEKYGEALDAFEWRLAFLVLWQILELVTLQSSDKLDMKTVKNRTVNLLGQDALIRDLLTVLYETRNLLVHRGSFPDEQGLREVNLLKFVVERVINRLFSLLRTCPRTVNLERYYQLISVNNSELADRKRIIQYIQRSRR